MAGWIAAIIEVAQTGQAYSGSWLLRAASESSCTTVKLTSLDEMKYKDMKLKLKKKECGKELCQNVHIVSHTVHCQLFILWMPKV